GHSKCSNNKQNPVDFMGSIDQRTGSSSYKNTYCTTTLKNDKCPPAFSISSTFEKYSVVLKNNILIEGVLARSVRPDSGAHQYEGSRNAVHASSVVSGKDDKPGIVFLFESIIKVKPPQLAPMLVQIINLQTSYLPWRPVSKERVDDKVFPQQFYSPTTLGQTFEAEERPRRWVCMLLKCIFGQLNLSGLWQCYSVYRNYVNVWEI
ncbi:hypothetical protein CEXT_79411, partial [Caerostris extrusa]